MSASTLVDDGEPCRAAGRYPLTHLQWSRLERARQAERSGNVPRNNLVRYDYRLVAHLDLSRLQAAAAGVSKRQPALRSTIELEAQTMAPCDHPAGLLVALDADGPPDALPLGEPHRAWLGVRASGDREWSATLLVDHLVFDGVSVEALWRALLAGYESSSDPQTAPDGCRCDLTWPRFLTTEQKPPSAAVTERALKTAGLLNQAESPFGFVEVPTRLPMSETGTRETNSGSTRVPLDDEALARAAAHHRASPFLLTVASVYAGIAEWAGTTMPMFYTYLANRWRREERAAIGWFSQACLQVAQLEQTEPRARLSEALDAARGTLMSSGRFTELVHRETGAGMRGATRPSVSLGTPPSAREFLSDSGAVRVLAVDTEALSRAHPTGRIHLDLRGGELVYTYEYERFSHLQINRLATLVANNLGRWGS